MKLGYVGINYKNADLAVRDKIVFTDSSKADFMQNASKAGVDQILCLSTCNRCEVFFLYEEEDKLGKMKALYMQKFGLTADDENTLLGVKCGDEALEYLFRIAAGHESMVQIGRAHV